MLLGGRSDQTNGYAPKYIFETLSAKEFERIPARATGGQGTRRRGLRPQGLFGTRPFGKPEAKAVAAKEWGLLTGA